MAAATQDEVQEVVDEDDFEVDEGAEYGDEPAGSKTTNTANFMGGDVEIVDEIEDLGVAVAETGQASYDVRVIEDVGPVFYGKHEIELKKGRKYRVPPHVHRYLNERKVLWEQQ